jgi:hypothetical protein
MKPAILGIGAEPGHNEQRNPNASTQYFAFGNG